ncbi:MAG TPA: FAD-binding oxidoreductase [Chitinophagaceae bacterium]
MAYTVKILDIQPLTHDVRAYKIEKPAGYTFNAGQATEVSINKPGWENEKRPFTFTCLNSDDHLEFVIKSYHDHPGVTSQLDKLAPGDELIIDDPWGAIEYKGPGYFIAGGAGITPFIAILREQARKGTVAGNILFFSSKTTADIILEKEFSRILGSDAVFTITHETPPAGYTAGLIDESFLKSRVSDFSKHFYVCGPDAMVQAISATLEKLGASPEAVVFEK